MIIVGITIYFKTNTYDVLFAVDGNLYQKIEVRKHTSLHEIPKPEKEGYAFIGWYDEEENILETTTVIDKDSVYYARWAEIVTE